MLTLFEKGLIAHLIADWLLQNEWMAINKSNLAHPAAWVHGAIHGILLGLFMGWQAGLVLAVVHMFIDTRIPINVWQQLFKHTGEAGDGPHVLHVSIWSDQVLHIVTIAAWVAFMGG